MVNSFQQREVVLTMKKNAINGRNNVRQLSSSTAAASLSSLRIQKKHHARNIPDSKTTKQLTALLNLNDKKKQKLKKRKRNDTASDETTTTTTSQQQKQQQQRHVSSSSNAVVAPTAFRPFSDKVLSTNNNNNNNNVSVFSSKPSLLEHAPTFRQKQKIAHCTSSSSGRCRPPAGDNNTSSNRQVKNNNNLIIHKKHKKPRINDKNISTLAAVTKKSIMLSSSSSLTATETARSKTDTVFIASSASNNKNKNDDNTKVPMLEQEEEEEDNISNVNKPQPPPPLSVSLLMGNHNKKMNNIMSRNNKSTNAPRRYSSHLQNNNPSLQSLFSSTMTSSTATTTATVASMNGGISKVATVKNPYITQKTMSSNQTIDSITTTDASDLETGKVLVAATGPITQQHHHDSGGLSSSSRSAPADPTTEGRRVSQSPMPPPPTTTTRKIATNGQDYEEEDYNAMIADDSFYLENDYDQDEEEEEEDDVLENHLQQPPPEQEQEQLQVAPQGRRSTAVPLSSLEPIPRLMVMGNNNNATTTKDEIALEVNNKKQKKPAGNFVRTNLRNGAGSCRGARNTKTMSKAALRFKERKEQWKSSSSRYKTNNNNQYCNNNDNDDDDNDIRSSSWTMRVTSSAGNNLNHASSLTGIDPVDDYVDGVFTAAAASNNKDDDETTSSNIVDNKKSSKTKASAPKKRQRLQQQNQSSPLPLCSGHQRPCALRTVKKNTSGNKGRQFYCCALQPRSEQCNHFQWADDTAQATERALQQNQTHSGFVARQVAAYMERIKVLTVPELRNLTKQHDLRCTGKKQELLARMAIWVRDEIASTCREEKEIINQQEQQLRKEEDKETSTTTPNVATAVDQQPEIEPGDKKSNPPKGIHDESQDDDSDSSASSSSEEELELFASSGMKKQNEFSDEDSDDDDDDDEESQDVDDETTEETRLALKPKNSKASNAKRPLPKDPLLSSLFTLFGHESFREGQEWAIRRCLDKKRTLWVAPTGFGKSLCYALPAALTEGICIVVSPLLSLIQDQLRVLPPSIPAATLSGPLSTTKMVATLDDICRGRIKVVFVSPERLTSAAFRRFFRQRWNAELNIYERQFPTVSLLCVDEAHCLSQWAHNFRPCYLRMRGMVNLIAPDSILAITATAGPRVISDICKTLGIDGTHITDQNEGMDSLTETPSPSGVRIMKTDRDNIDVSCLILSTQQERLSKLVNLLSPVQRTKGNQTGKEKEDCDNGCLSTGSVIVYVWRQRDAEAVAENIQQSGLVDGGVVIYHGGMDSGTRTKAQSMFLRGKARICVATVAFGLGINKSDVSGVIHLYLAASPEHYLQEIGRAGRDGRPAKAVALILRDEVVVRHSLTHSDFISKSQIAALLRVLKASIDDCFAVLPENRSATEPLSIGLSLEKAVVACGFKEETLETLVSLLEERDGKVPLMSVEGAIYDSATIAPMRRHLSQLATMEPIAKAILQSTVCFEAPAGEEMIAPLGQESFSSNKGRKLVGYSYGSYTFSVSQCANCLGPTAEPRHVYAALRRLQSCGELQLVLDTSPAGRGLNLRISSEGVTVLRQDTSKNDELIQELEGRLTSTIVGASNKVLDIDGILRSLSNVTKQSMSSKKTKDANVNETKSPALCIFQQRMREYFGQTGDGQLSVSAKRNETIVPNEFASVPPLKQLSNDVLSVIRHLLEMELALVGMQQKQQQQPNGCRQSPPPPLKLDDPSHMDYAALAITKFLHGMAPVTAPYMACRQHMLFGSLQAVRFDELQEAVMQALGPILCPTRK